MVAIGGFFGGALMGIYLWLSNSLIGAHSNEVFSCQSSPDYKNFLRLHIDRNGQLTIYQMGVEKVCKSWRFNKSAKDGQAWFEPHDGKINQYAHLFETPVPVTVASKKATSFFHKLFRK